MCRFMVCARSRSMGNREIICSRKSKGVMADRSNFNLASNKSSQSCEKEKRQILLLHNLHERGWGGYPC